MTRTIRRGRLAKLVALGASAMLLATMIGQVSAASVTPSLVTAVPGQGGFWSCPDGLKIDPVEDGTYQVGDVEITIDVYSTPNGPEFNFTSPDYVNSILVKGGPNANLYSYGSPGVQSDTALHAPLNSNNGKWYGLSHLCVGLTKK